MNKIYVIGIGYKPFEKKAQEILFNADHILTSRRLFEVFTGYDEFAALQEKVVVINKVDETVEFIRNNFRKRSIVLLASGDPMFFGIGRKVLIELGTEAVEMLPDLSSVQIAFSRIKEAWDDAFLMSLHGGPDKEKRRRLPFEIHDIPALLQDHHKIAILTDRQNNPAEIARGLLRVSAFPGLRIFVCEKLGHRDEKITSGSPGEIAGGTFSEPNVVILLKREAALVDEQRASPVSSGFSAPALSVAFGLTEAEITHSRGLITKDEVRAVSLHKLRLPQEGILWDVGAGSGSLSIEAMRLFPGLKVYAVEKDEDQISHIEDNKKRFGAVDIVARLGEAPGALEDLPSPDRVFVGGSGGKLTTIVRSVSERMPRGIIVINAVTLETLNEALQLLEGDGFAVEITQVSVVRSKVLSGQRHMAALNPVFVIRGQKE